MSISNKVASQIASRCVEVYDGETILASTKIFKVMEDEFSITDESDRVEMRQAMDHVKGYTYDIAALAGKTTNSPATATAAAPTAVVEMAAEPAVHMEVVSTTPPAVPQKDLKIVSITNEDVHVPAKDKLFVAWGNYSRMEKVVVSDRFFPVYISGDSGNGKSKMIEQACAKKKREQIRVQINIETTEDDLIGGFRLVEGDTIFVKGPVIKAMEAGSILMIDEIDRGSNLLLCLQGVLEGTPFLIKKTGEVIIPQPGFNIIATGNSKGRGDDTGKFDSNILDEAFLERFRILLQQEYPSASIEKKILAAKMKAEDVYDPVLLDRLVLWIDGLRKSMAEGSIDTCISTRRSCGIVETFAIFGDIDEAIDLGTNRFDDETKAAFVEFWELTKTAPVEESNDSDASSTADPTW